MRCVFLCVCVRAPVLSLAAFPLFSFGLPGAKLPLEPFKALVVASNLIFLVQN